MRFSLPLADDWSGSCDMATSKLALEVLVLPPLRAATVGTIGVMLPLPLPLPGCLAPMLSFDPNLARALARPLRPHALRSPSALIAHALPPMQFYSCREPGQLSPTSPAETLPPRLSSRRQPGWTRRVILKVLKTAIDQWFRHRSARL